MPRSDGTVIIDTKMDMSGLNKGTVDIKHQFDRMSNSAKLTADSISSAFSRPLENAKAKVEFLEGQLEGVQAKLREALSEGDDKPAEKYVAQRERIYDRLEYARRKLEIEVRAAAARQAEAEEKAAQKAEAAARKAAEAEEKAAQKAEAAARKAAEAEEKAAQKTEAANRKAAESARAISKETKTSANNMSGMEKSARRFKSRMREIVTGAFFFNIISSALTRLTQTLWGSISSTDQMKSALSNLQGAAYTAASPLLNVLANAFTVLANAIATALSYLTQLYSLLSGKSLSALSQTAKQMGNVANAAGAAGGAADKAKKSLAGFDEITALAPKDSGGGGGGGGGGITPNYDYNLESGINPQIQALANKIKELIAPLQKIDFTEAKKSLETLGKSFKNLGKTIGGALESAWKTIMVPLAKWTIEQAAPETVNTLSEAIDLLTAMLDPLIDGFDILMGAMKPIFSFIGDSLIMIIKALGDQFDKIADVFKTKGDTIRDIFKNVGDAIDAVWIIVKPIMEAMRNVFLSVFNFIGDIVSQKIATVLDILAGLSNFIAGVFTGDWKRAWEGIKKVFSTIAESISTTIKTVTDFIGQRFLAAVSAVQTAWKGVSEWFETNVAKPIRSAFDGIWGTIMGALSGETTIGEFAEGIGDAVRGALNNMISGINSMLVNVIMRINNLLRKIKFFKIPGISGYPFGAVNVIYPTPQIPYLAKGAVIPPHAPFMAMLGDQPHGTNIEAPLSTIQEALRLELSDIIPAMLSGFESVLAEQRAIRETVSGIEIGDSVIGEAVERYNRTMGIVRGG